MDTRAWWTTDPRVAELDMTEETYQAGMQAARGAYPGGSVVKNLPANAGDTDSIPGWRTKIPHALEQLGLRVATTEASLNCPSER